MSKITDRMQELCAPIDKQIMMCDDKDDILMMACLIVKICLMHKLELKAEWK